MADVPSLETLGDRVLYARMFRRAGRLSQRELATRVGCSVNQLSRIELGRVTKPNSDVIVRLSIELNVTTDWLLKGAASAGGGATQPPGDSDPPVCHNRGS